MGTNVEEAANITETKVEATTSTNNAKTAFMDDTLRDGFDVNKILGDYLKKANKSWGQKKEEELGEESLVELVVKLRTIVKITHHNLELLDANLVSGCLAAFPGLDSSRLNPLTIEGEQPRKQDDEKNKGLQDKGKDEAGTSQNLEEANENEQTNKNKESPRQASVETSSKTKEEEKKSSGNEQRGKTSSNIPDHEEDGSLSSQRS